MDTAIVVLTNCPDAASAERIAIALVDQHLAACVSRLAPVASIYRWHGRIEHASEVPLLIKTTHERYPAVEEAIRAAHPYEVPEIVALPIVAGFAPYLRWIADQTQPPMLA